MSDTLITKFPPVYYANGSFGPSMPLEKLNPGCRAQYNDIVWSVPSPGVPECPEDNIVVDYNHSAVKHTLYECGLDVARLYRESPMQVFPAANQVFNAFNTCDLRDIEFVILGHCTYLGQKSNGIAFSCNDGDRVSNMSSPVMTQKFINMIIEAGADISLSDLLLQQFTRGKILMLNSILTSTFSTVSHEYFWQPFIIKILQIVIRLNPTAQILCFGEHARTIGSHLQFNMPGVHIHLLSMPGESTASQRAHDIHTIKTSGLVQLLNSFAAS